MTGVTNGTGFTTTVTEHDIPRSHFLYEGAYMCSWND